MSLRNCRLFMYCTIILLHFTNNRLRNSLKINNKSTLNEWIKKKSKEIDTILRAGKERKTITEARRQEHTYKLRWRWKKPRHSDKIYKRCLIFIHNKFSWSHFDQVKYLLLNSRSSFRYSDSDIIYIYALTQFHGVTFLA